MPSKPLSSFVRYPFSGADRMIEGLSLDSRRVKDNYLFFAVKGDSLDGHEYISQAIDNGAGAILLDNNDFIESSGATYVHCPSLKTEIGNIASQFYGNPTEFMSVFGVTGTNGKTSITHYIAQIFEALGQSCGLIGTLGVEYKNMQIDTGNTTPDAVTLQRSFYEMLQNGVKNVAMEVSSHALTQYRCVGVHFDTVVISNVTHDHLDYHGNFDSYMDAKLTLFRRPEIRIAIINADDGSAEKIRRIISSSVGLISYSCHDKNADVYLSNVSANGSGFIGSLHYKGSEYSLSIPLLGDFNLYNVLAAIISVCEHGFDVAEVIGVIGKLKSVPGRMELVPNRHNVIAVVDYAHTPDALESVLKSLRKQVSGKVIVVFGCGGDRDKAKRPKMASIAELFADYVIVTADNPRTEKLEDILDDIAAGMKGGDYQIVPDRDIAISLAVSKAAANDCILVAGKGHEKTQVTGCEIKPFDDIQVLSRALEEKQVMPC